MDVDLSYVANACACSVTVAHEKNHQSDAGLEMFAAGTFQISEIFRATTRRWYITNCRSGSTKKSRMGVELSK